MKVWVKSMLKKGGTVYESAVAAQILAGLIFPHIDADVHDFFFDALRF